MRWYYLDLNLCIHPECGWDFGMRQDIDWLKRGRKQYHVPFEWVNRESDGMGIWERLKKRWAALNAKRIPGMLADEGLADARPDDAPGSPG